MADTLPEVDSGVLALRTQTQLSCAHTLVREAETQVAQNALLGLDEKYAQTVMAKLRAKLASTTRLTKDLQDRVSKVDSMMRRLRESDLQLQRATALKQAPLCVCTRRLDLRSRRAPSELSRDFFQQAIEAEEAALVLARKELNESSQITRELLPRLEEAKQELLSDVLEKRRSGRIDHLCLLDSSRRPVLSNDDVIGAPTFHEIMSSDHLSSPRDGHGCGNMNEEQRKELTKSNILKAAALCFEGLQRCEANRARIDIHGQQCDAANKRTDTAMKRSIATLASQRKQLEQQLDETNQMLSAGKLSLGWTERKLRQHENPLQALSRQFTVRDRRAERENIRDPVHDHLTDHLGALKRSVQTLSTHVDNTHQLVQELQSTKDQLQEQLGLKTMSLRLDQACLKCTLKSVAGHFFSLAPRPVSAPADMTSSPQSSRGTSRSNSRMVTVMEEPTTLLSSRSGGTGGTDSMKALVSPRTIPRMASSPAI